MAVLATRAWQVGSQLNVYTGIALHKAILHDVGRERKHTTHLFLGRPRCQRHGTSFCSTIPKPGGDSRSYTILCSWHKIHLSYCNDAIRSMHLYTRRESQLRIRMQSYAAHVLVTEMGLFAFLWLDAPLYMIHWRVSSANRVITCLQTVCGFK